MSQTNTGTSRVGITPAQMIEAVRRMRRSDRQEFIEDLLAETSPEYLQSIKEARADRAAGRVRTISEVFGK